MYIDGRLQSPDAPFQAERARLLGQRRDVLEYRDPGDLTKPVQAGAVDPNALKNLYAPKGPKGRSAASIAAEAEERTKRYLDQLAGLQQTELRAQANLTGSIDKRADIEVDLAARALKKQLDDIESERKRNVLKGSDAGLEATRARELGAAARLANATTVAGINQQRQADLINATNEHLLTRLSIEGEVLSTQATLATTRREQLALELRALANQKEQDRVRLQGQVDTLKPGDPARADAQTRLSALDTTYAGREQATRQGRESPLAAYRRQLQGAVGDTHDALEQVKVNALGRIEDQLSSTIGKVLGLKGAFGELAASIIQDLAKIEIEKAILGSTGGSSGGGLGGLFGSIARAVGLGGNGYAGGTADSVLGQTDEFLPGFASGGTATIGGRPGVDQNVLSINGQPSLRVGQGEVLSVVNPALANRSVAPPVNNTTVVQHISVDGRNSVTPEGFADDILSRANGYARQAAVRSGQAAVDAAPAAVRRVQTLGS